MQKIKVISAEWNPDNQVLVTIANVRLDGPSHEVEGKQVWLGMDSKTKQKITLDNLTESQATYEVVNALLLEKGFDAQIKFSIN